MLSIDSASKPVGDSQRRHGIPFRHLLENVKVEDIVFAQLLQPDNYQYAFSSPIALTRIFTHYSHRRAAIRHIRLYLYDAMYDTYSTAYEYHDGADQTNRNKFTEAWREVFKVIPVKHDIKSIEFDMGSESDEPQCFLMGHLLQHISTIANLRSEGGVRCGVSGCDDEVRKRLEKQLFPNKDDHH